MPALNILRAEAKEADGVLLASNTKSADLHFFNTRVLKPDLKGEIIILLKKVGYT